MGNAKTYHFPFVWIQGNTFVKQLSISHLHRREYVNPVETVRIEKNGVVDVLNIHDVTVEDHTGKGCSTLFNCGTVKKLCISGVSENEIKNEGSIEFA